MFFGVFLGDINGNHDFNNMPQGRTSSTSTSQKRGEGQEESTAEQDRTPRSKSKTQQNQETNQPTIDEHLHVKQPEVIGNTDNIEETLKQLSLKLNHFASQEYMKNMFKNYENTKKYF